MERKGTGGMRVDGSEGRGQNGSGGLGKGIREEGKMQVVRHCVYC